MAEVNEYVREVRGDLSALRAILIFGKNSATYKFALCNALMQQRPVSQLKYSDLRETFLKSFIEHFRLCPSQFQGARETSLIKASHEYVAGTLSWDRYCEVAERTIYNNVFDAFQNIGNGSLDKKSLLFEHDRGNRKIILTDELNAVLSDPATAAAVLEESQSRWRVVEEAWRVGLSPNLLYDVNNRLFFREMGNQRVSLRSAVTTLMPYQKGMCFYCGEKLELKAVNGDSRFPDVDHFLPHVALVRELPEINPDGVWNLVISCLQCNRGSKGKFDQIPADNFFEKLTRRNVFMAEEHSHSLKYSVLKSLGVSRKEQIKEAMQRVYRKFQVFGRWSPHLG